MSKTSYHGIELYLIKAHSDKTADSGATVVLVCGYFLFLHLTFTRTASALRHIMFHDFKAHHAYGEIKPINKDIVDDYGDFTGP